VQVASGAVMNPAMSGIVLCLAYILGLLFTAIPWGGGCVLGLGVFAAVILPRFWRGHFTARIWLMAGVVGLVASLYFQWRIPQPGSSDVSRFFPTADAAQEKVAVAGQILSTPRLTRSQKMQFWLGVNQLSQAVMPDGSRSPNQPVTGKVYVTVPLIEATELHPGRTIAVIGTLYHPQPAANPGGFDFKEYLAQEDSFAGLKGQCVFDFVVFNTVGRDFSTVQDCAPSLPIVLPNTDWGWWAVQERIVRAQFDRLGTPEGPLVSSMVLGSKVVDLPYDVKDNFQKIGLSHALAASGFQTSLILGVILALTRKYSERGQFILGLAGLLIFLALTGVQPAVLRAVLMGTGVLIGIVLKRQVKPLGSLLLTAVILLVYDPLWIWDLGFQLSFLATLGLLVTAGALTARLDWLPSTWSPLIAVPIAAYIWTLPLQLYAFGIVSPFSIIANVATTIPISIISIGGIISALLALISPDLGSFSAWLLYYPTHWLIDMVNGFCRLPGNSLAVGTIPAGMAILLYGLICVPWLLTHWQKRWWVIGLASISLVMIPAWQARTGLLQVTALATRREPVLVIQDRGRVLLVNSGDAATAKATVVPFLQQQGVNQIDWAIAGSQPTVDSGWAAIGNRIPTKNIMVLPARRRTEAASVPLLDPQYPVLDEGQTIKLNATTIQLLKSIPTWVQIQVGDQRWLWLKDVPQKFWSVSALQGHQVLWWSGKAIAPEILAAIRPEVAIAYAAKLDPATRVQLKALNAKVYTTAQAGAIQWTPATGFKSTLELDENGNSRL
jgi:competence protein ComEC